MVLPFVNCIVSLEGLPDNWICETIVTLKTSSFSVKNAAYTEYQGGSDYGYLEIHGISDQITDYKITMTNGCTLKKVRDLDEAEMEPEYEDYEGIYAIYDKNGKKIREINIRLKGGCYLMSYTPDKDGIIQIMETDKNIYILYDNPDNFPKLKYKCLPGYSAKVRTENSSGETVYYLDFYDDSDEVFLTKELYAIGG